MYHLPLDLERDPEVAQDEAPGEAVLTLAPKAQLIATVNQASPPCLPQLSDNIKVLYLYTLPASKCKFMFELFFFFYYFFS